ncbi:Hint domain-containing protein [Cribrihabitans pelagius]|uniref:Hint domain-containing protein n=1 Tax=Cribrihabitans pelagius TaxID=1765746 RepID=UPI003B5A72C3
MLDWFSKRKAGPLASGFPLVAAGQGGFLEGTLVASSFGWRPVEALAPGDRVLTFDHGMQPVLEVEREVLALDGEAMDPARCPLLVPRDALMNRNPMWMMPDQGVLLESELAQDAMGDPFAVVPAAALEGYRGIARMHPGRSLSLAVPRFAQDQVIYLEAGALGFTAAPRNLMCGRAVPEQGLYRLLPPEEARGLVLSLIDEEAQWAAGLPRNQFAEDTRPPLS